ncbi:hypothetical protein [Paeniglutamicibacter sulfureus]|uniref:Uncharacterized protein n=1 Tax=Paeniglutamicibacter sulfureus TaxID=43666 RepID=A0ABU2BMX0_9MICC|nr:hypothetical protein [Paeniglutamicibacter sulfureus]MDR7360007.1 hypothetical protein [Paeniglutamicibacter sulfureus]
MPSSASSTLPVSQPQVLQPQAAAPLPDLTTGPGQLPTFRLNMMRGGYLFMAVGLMIVKWPLLLQASSMPVFEGVVLCILTAMSLLAFLGLRYPLGMLPILLFETMWKVLWLAIVALPHLIANDMDAATATMLFNVLFVVPILAVTPWGYVWKRYVMTRGERWVRGA